MKSFFGVGLQEMCHDFQKLVQVATDAAPRDSVRLCGTMVGLTPCYRMLHAILEVVPCYRRVHAILDVVACYRPCYLTAWGGPRRSCHLRDGGMISCVPMLS